MGQQAWFKRMDISESGLRGRGYTQQAVMVLSLFLLLFTHLSSIQAQDRYQDEKSVESKEQPSQQTKSGQLKKYEEVIHPGAK